MQVVINFPPAPNNANTFLPPVVVIPGSLIITAISNSFPMAVSFINTSANLYIPGQVMNLNIPSNYGMQQANGLQAQILSVDDTNFIFYMNVDSTNFDIFMIPEY